MYVEKCSLSGVSRRLKTGVMRCENSSAVLRRGMTDGRASGWFGDGTRRLIRSPVAERNKRFVISYSPPVDFLRYSPGKSLKGRNKFNKRNSAFVT